MPTRRTPLRRNLRRRITPVAIAAWKAADYIGLHRALNLAPWEASPLPRRVTGLGVDAGMAVDPNSNWRGVGQALELQRELLAVAGPPTGAARG